MPRRGVDYPATFQQLLEWFPDDAACVEYLAGLRWPEGFRCPGCGHPAAWRTGEGLWMCRACGKKTSVTAGTVFHRSRLPLSNWFQVVWLVCAQKHGVSALGLQRVLGFGSYQTAWAWLHKLRRAMVRPDRDQLEGLIEVDETYVGAVEHGKDGRGVEKPLVAVAVEMRENPRRLGRVRLQRLDDVTATQLTRFVTEVASPGSVIRTDGWSIYQGLTSAGFCHQPISITASGQPAHVVLPGVHRVASLLKRWLQGTHHSGISARHLDYYLDEFTFRFNRRNSRSRGLLFYRLLQQAVNTDPHPYHQLLYQPNPDTLPQAPTALK